ncbi:hypothetical protein H8K90_05350 [Winogradskyella echinorum]|uniref:Lipocalin-like domain-containing protein n=1 Tax=Winogradskyella echinorum TaxID=538189 RepID=A0ABR6XZE7_9FLAO|nr:hypothetical protein [Winogradskyella echinorum]MBC3845794.1 hypothetical protein [Winogradskyella echinorum]MBC5750142.1 hypothetical protein [Winogradskyella echinorum]
MKKLLSLFCLFTLLTAFTCENEPLDSDVDLETGDTNLDLIGTWDLVEFSTTLGNEMDFAGQIITSDLDVYSTETNYILEFTANTFTTNGNYSYNASVVVDGVEFSNEPYTLDNVSGNGSYSTNGNEMTVDGQFFEFSFEGEMDSSALEGEQTATFELSEDGQTLTFTQNEIVVTDDAATGTTVTSNVQGSSVWVRQ